MSRQRNNTKKIYSSISDEQLAVIIARDFKRNPSEFISPSCLIQESDLSDSKSFLHNTSARGIEPLKKWL